MNKSEKEVVLKDFEKQMRSAAGKLDFENPYFNLSQKINTDLIANNKDALIIMLGFNHMDLFEKVFDLPELGKIIKVF